MTLYSTIPGAADIDGASRYAAFNRNPADPALVAVMPSRNQMGLPQRPAPGKPLPQSGRPRVIWENG